ncbi:unnamed protein product [Auanema sp. JU1783]|nr:unnamed protein product [Auanema sp. JU1783]
MDDETNHPFKMISDKPRELTEDDVEKLKKQTFVSDFKKNKLENEAQKNWDKFYNRNTDKFFKDRNWSPEDVKLLCKDMDFQADLTYLEAGCGVGNMLFPLAFSYPSLKLQAFDFSKNAVEMLRKRAAEHNMDVETTVLDLSKPIEVPVFSRKANFATLIFVMSAIPPEKFATVVANMKDLMADGGSLLIRDYAINDHAMIRFGRESKVADRFYTRQDGTLAYYFELEELVELFERDGFTCSNKEYLYRRTINKEKGVNVPRAFVQARLVRNC